MFGDILFGKLRPYLAKVLLSDFEAKAVGDFFVFRMKQDVIPEFISKLILSRNFIDVVNSSTFGSKMPRVSWDFISHLLIPFPSIPEQQAIADYLDRKTAEVDELIADKQRLLELYQEERTALINQAVTQGVPRSEGTTDGVSSPPTKDSGTEWIGEIPAHWEVSRMKNICSVRQGLQIEIEKRHLIQVDNSLKYITIRSINNPGNPKEYIENPPKNVVCSPDDILMARTGATGEPIINVNGVFHNNFFLIDYDRQKIDKMFLYYFLKSVRIKEYLLLVAGTTTIPDLNHGDFYNTPFLMFSLEEQQAIVYYIETECVRIDTKVARTQQLIDLLTEYRTALISEVVTGKVKVID